MRPAIDPLSNTLSALSDPTRRAIVARLALGEATVSELTAPLGISMPAVSRHLKVLEAAGLIERGRDAQFRPCRLRPERLGDVRAWIDDIRATWEGRLDRLEAYLAELQSTPAVDATPKSDVTSTIDATPKSDTTPAIDAAPTSETTRTSDAATTPAIDPKDPHAS